MIMPVFSMFICTPKNYNWLIDYISSVQSGQTPEHSESNVSIDDDNFNTNMQSL